LTTNLGCEILGLEGKGGNVAQFTSPRFSGDSVLEDILSDATEAKKLQGGSPTASVTKVQQALFDLGWNFRADPAVEDESAFVDGIYGPVTTNTVRNYKIFYDIHFPSSAAFGSYDGFAGSATLQHLDRHIVLFDEAVTAINNKFTGLQGAGINIQMSVSNAFGERTTFLDCTPGAVHRALIDGGNAAIFFKHGVGAFEVHGAILEAYGAAGGAHDVFGFPTSDEHDDGAGFRRSDFENGSLRLDTSTSQVQQLGAAAGETPHVPLF
jgi:hypothetical protein